MRFDIITLFPEMFEAFLSKGVVGSAVQNKVLDVHLMPLKSFSEHKHGEVDDRPFGGGDGMVLCPQPLARAIESTQCDFKNRCVIYLTPQGHVLNNRRVHQLLQWEQLVLICGRYGGIDERINQIYVNYELSIGDYVLSGGEPAALVLLDAVARQLPGVLGNPVSAQEDSFSENRLEGPVFTRPRYFAGQEVPEVLLSGDHARIAHWRHCASLLRTHLRRPDLCPQLPQVACDFWQALSPEEKKHIVS